MNHSCFIFRHHYHADGIVVLSWNISTMYANTRVVTGTNTRVSWVISRPSARSYPNLPYTKEFKSRCVVGKLESLNNILQVAWGRFSINMTSYQYRNSHLRARRSRDRLIVIMEIPYLDILYTHMYIYIYKETIYIYISILKRCASIQNEGRRDEVTQFANACRTGLWCHCELHTIVNFHFRPLWTTQYQSLETDRSHVSFVATKLSGPRHFLATKSHVNVSHFPLSGHFRVVARVWWSQRAKLTG